MALCALFCVWFAYRSQQVSDLARFDLGDTRVVVRCAPAGRIEADAMLLATSTSLRMLGGVPGAVGVAGGLAAIEREALAAAPASLGKVVATGAGRLAVDRIFHAAVHEPLRAVDQGQLRRGLESAAQQARKAGAETVAVPVGVLRGMPFARGARIAAEAVLKHRRAFSEIVFVALAVQSGPALRAAVEEVVQELSAPGAGAGQHRGGSRSSAADKR
jgi:O-acetyl-ADP-ribose deacetylase (regulator of RNase III)